MNQKETESLSGRPPELRRPWSPTGIAVLCFIFSPIPAGILHALNYARLGHPERQRLALFSNLITAVVVFAIPVRLTATFFIAAYFYKSQEHSFQEHLDGGGEKASLLIPTILSILGTLVLVLGFYGLYYIAQLLVS